jgi:hypothetical protein
MRNRPCFESKSTNGNPVWPSWNKPDLEGQAGIAGAEDKEEVALLRDQITALKADLAKLVEDNLTLKASKGLAT